MKKKPEILAPAGSLEKLKIAIDFGADAVYLAGEKLNLEAFSDNFTNEEMIEGIKYCHERGKKVYVNLNIFARNYDLKDAGEYIKRLYDIEVDAILIADPSLISIAKEIAPQLDIHLSTQANTVNWVAAKFWHDIGIKRIVLSKELTFKEIKTITENIPDSCEIECFVHGSMCIAYSGRSLISNYILGRDAHKQMDLNECEHKYNLVEETRPGEYYPIVEDKNGTYIMNSKDLCMIHYIPELVESGINSFKIEGRMQSEFYIASTIKAYREALDRYYDDSQNYQFQQEWMDILNRVSHRPYHTGFYLGKNDEQNYEEKSYTSDYKIIGIVEEYDAGTQTAIIMQKNKAFNNTEVEILRPYMPYFKVNMSEMYDIEKDCEIEEADRSHMRFKVKVNIPLQKNDIIIKGN